MASKRKRRRPRKKPASQGIFVRRGEIQWLNVGVLLLIIAGLVGIFIHYRPVILPQSTEKHPRNLTQQQFIRQLAPEAKRTQREYHVLASITLAQAILESDWGQSTNARENNNLFGVKASAAEPSAILPTQEYYDGNYHTVKQRFRVYSSWQASVEAHAKLLANGTTTDSQHYQQVLAADNYEQAAAALVKAGYATDPVYAQKLEQLIKTYHLNRYD